MGQGGQDCQSLEAVSKRLNDCKVSSFPAWASDVAECEKHYRTSRTSGLKSEDVERRRMLYSPNELEHHEGVSILSLILEQFNDTLVRILLGAAVVSFILAWCSGEGGGANKEITAFVEPLVIFLILILNATVGVWQESNAEKALEALKEIQSEQATAVRDGKMVLNLPARELVPGDIVELKVGDKVPADMRVLELISSTLRLEQGSLTGESEAVNKTSKAIAEEADITGQEMHGLRRDDRGER